MSSLTRLVFAIGTALGIGAAGGFAVSHSNSAVAALPSTVDGQPLPSLAPMIERIAPAVVNISSKTRTRVRDPLLDDPFFRRFFGVPNMPREHVEQSLGSGVIVDAGKGFVLTNNHVVEGADDITVTLNDGRTLKAKLVGTDPDTDVAVIQIPADNLRAVPLADSTTLRVGDFVIAVGNPFGLGQSVTSGIVSALGRSGLRGLGYQNFIQTDASINPGNSGGALVNLSGELVGINTAIFSPSGGNVGIGFAIPSTLANTVMKQLVSTGTVKRGSLGVETQNVTPDIAQMLGVPPGRGAVITRVMSNSVAEAAGLRPGDVVVEINGKSVGSEQDLHNAEGLLPIGSDVELKVLRDGASVTATAKLAVQESLRAEGQKLDPRLAGAEFGELGERLRQQGLRGVAIQRVGASSRAESNGLRAGDVVVAVNQVDVRSVEDLKALTRRQPRQLLLTVVRGSNAYFVMCE
ncbi:Do family serine endopeptidase [Tahibacter amnicola]|uniref:Do family serine endopeptidase n=1 Tax=Tahibacter amnicola TaxID=2976241 RepID=A0ABY6BD71_9GAMM|nr:Do family serine endopeptidase [Tahibacter amnicola]UXI67988.1 Do family serine endopeptidase [Tahibacter amnicola]